MGLGRFILGVLGAILIIGAFSSFLPLVFFGGIATGSFAFAFGLPIFLMIFGAAMVYFGFYYTGKTEKSPRSNYELSLILKWGIIFTIAVLISDYILNKLVVVNTFWEILFTALLVSIVVQIVRSHEHERDFKMKWFFFYFLVYANTVWAIGEYVLPKIAFQTGFFSSIIVGFTLAGVFIVLQKISIKHHSLPWASIVLVMILLVSNLGDIQSFTGPIIIQHSNNFSISPEEKQTCPTIMSTQGSPSGQYISNFDNRVVGSYLNSLVNTSVWRIENDIRSCYKGKYKDQYPNWVYCDDMIVSRWDTSSSGTINYRWYTAVSAEWRPEIGAGNILKYVLNDFSCENGQKVTVDKEATSYYVHVARDGTEIRVEY